MSNFTADEVPPSGKMTQDGFLAISILVGTSIIIVVVGLYLWRNKRLLGLGDGGWRTSTFTPPPARENYIAGREKMDPSVPTECEELKKLLMRRAIQAIPLVIQLQNEGNSIERLYKKGMLTDDMHFKVKELKGFVDQEFQEVMAEADELVEGWGSQIWPQAMQFHHVIQKQAEEKNEEAARAEEQKKKAILEKKKEKERAKRLQKIGAVGAPAASSSSSSSGGGGGAGGNAETELPEAMDPETLKELEAERMAQKLVEEEERERSKKLKAGGTKKK